MGDRSYLAMLVLSLMMVSPFIGMASRPDSTQISAQSPVSTQLPGIKEVLLKGRIAAASVHEGLVLLAGSFGARVYDASGRLVWRGLENEYVCMGAVQGSMGIIALYSEIGLELYSLNTGLLWINPNITRCPKHMEFSSKGLLAILVQEDRYLGYSDYDTIFKWQAWPSPSSTLILGENSSEKWSFTLPYQVLQMEWSSTGRYLALLTRGGLYIADTAEHSVIKVELNATPYGIAWSPINDTLAVAAGLWGVLLLRPNGTVIDTVYVGVDAGMVEWSPSGDRIAAGGMYAARVSVSGPEDMVYWFSHQYPDRILGLSWKGSSILVVYAVEDTDISMPGSYGVEVLGPEGKPRIQLPDPYSQLVYAGMLGEDKALLVTAERASIIMVPNTTMYRDLGPQSKAYRAMTAWGSNDASLIVGVFRESIDGWRAWYRIEAYSADKGSLWSKDIGLGISKILVSPDNSLVALIPSKFYTLGLIVLNASDGSLLWCFEGDVSAASWSSDSSSIALISLTEHGILVLGRDGVRKAFVEKGFLELPEDIAWSPDSKYLATVTALYSTDGYSIEVLSEQLESVYNYTYSGWYPTVKWGPPHILWVMYSDLNSMTILSIDPGLGASVNITGEISSAGLYDIDDLSPSPDGRYIAIAGNKQGTGTVIALFDKATMSQAWSYKVVSESGEGYYASVDVSGLSWTRKGNIAFLRSEECACGCGEHFVILSPTGGLVLDAEGLFDFYEPMYAVDEDRGIALVLEGSEIAVFNLTTGEREPLLPWRTVTITYSDYSEPMDAVITSLLNSSSMGLGNPSAEGIAYLVSNDTTTPLPYFHTASPNGSYLAYKDTWCTVPDAEEMWTDITVYHNSTRLWFRSMDQLTCPKLEWSQDSSLLAVSGLLHSQYETYAYETRLLDSATGLTIYTYHLDREEEAERVIVSDELKVLGEVFANRIELYNYSAGTHLDTIGVNLTLAASIAPSHGFLAYAYGIGKHRWSLRSSRIAVYSLEDKEVLWSTGLPEKRVAGLQWSPDESRIAVVTDTGHLIVLTSNLTLIKAVLDNFHQVYYGEADIAWYNNSLLAATLYSSWSSRPSLLIVANIDGDMVYETMIDLRASGIHWRGRELVITGDMGALLIDPLTALNPEEKVLLEGWSPREAVMVNGGIAVFSNKGFAVLGPHGVSTYRYRLRAEGGSRFDYRNNTLAVLYSWIDSYLLVYGHGPDKPPTNYTVIKGPRSLAVGIVEDKVVVVTSRKIMVFRLDNLSLVWNTSVSNGYYDWAALSPARQYVAVAKHSWDGGEALMIYDISGRLRANITDLEGYNPRLGWISEDTLAIALSYGDLVVVGIDGITKYRTRLGEYVFSMVSSPEAGLAAISTPRSLVAVGEEGITANISLGSLVLRGMDPARRVAYGFSYTGRLYAVSLENGSWHVYPPIRMNVLLVTPWNNTLLIVGWDVRTVDPVDYWALILMYQEVPVKACMDAGTWCSIVESNSRLFVYPGNHTLRFMPLTVPSRLGEGREPIGDPEWYLRLYVERSMGMEGFGVEVLSTPVHGDFMDAIGSLVLDATGSEYVSYDCNVSWDSGAMEIQLYSGERFSVKALPGDYEVGCLVAVQQGYNYTIPSNETTYNARVSVNVARDTLVELPYPTLITTTTETTTVTRTETTTQTTTLTSTITTTETTTQTMEKTVSTTMTQTETTTVPYTITETTTATQTTTATRTVTQTITKTSVKPTTIRTTSTATRTVTQTTTQTLTETHTTTMVSPTTITVTKSNYWPGIAVALIIILAAIAALTYTNRLKRKARAQA